MNGRTPNDSEREVIRNTLFNREERNPFEDALPRTKLNLSRALRPEPCRHPGGRNLLRLSRIQTHKRGPRRDLRGQDPHRLGRCLGGCPWGAPVGGGQQPVEHLPGRAPKEANIGSRGFQCSRRVTQFGTNGGFCYGRLSLDLEVDEIGKSLAEEAVSRLPRRGFSASLEIFLRQIYRCPL